MPRIICKAIKKNGEPCRYKAKAGGEGDLCGVHIRCKPSLECLECPICYDTISRGKRVLKCGHAFHKTCVDSWIDRKGTCPMCRTQIKTIAQPSRMNDINEFRDAIFVLLNEISSRVVRS
jgi:hypothetical protein